MTDPKLDPPRLLDQPETDALLRAALRGARERGPSEQQLLGLARRLPQAQEAATGPQAAVLRPVWRRAIPGALAVVIGGLGVWAGLQLFSWRQTPPSAASEVAPPMAAAKPAPPMAAAKSAPLAAAAKPAPLAAAAKSAPLAAAAKSAPLAAAAKPAPPMAAAKSAPPTAAAKSASPSTASDIAPPTAAAKSAPPSTASDIAPPTAAAMSAPGASAGAHGTGPRMQSAPGRTQRAAAKPQRAARASEQSGEPVPPPIAPAQTASAFELNASNAQASAPAQRAQSELELLARAQGLMGRDPRAALRVIALHEQRYPAGSYRQEREALALDALQRLGRGSELQARARAFLARYPGSPHGERIRGFVH